MSRRLGRAQRGANHRPFRSRGDPALSATSKLATMLPA
jgi:hypothetical protein